MGTVKYIDFEASAMTVGFFQDFYGYDASMIRHANFTVDNDKDYKLKQIYKERGNVYGFLNAPIMLVALFVLLYTSGSTQKVT